MSDCSEDCAFCETPIQSESVLPEHVLIHWRVFNSTWPARGASPHILIVANQHTLLWDDLDPEAKGEYQRIVRWLEDRYGLRYTMLLRQGDPARSGASVAHLHGHFLVQSSIAPYLEDSHRKFCVAREGLSLEEMLELAAELDVLRALELGATDAQRGEWPVRVQAFSEQPPPPRIFEEQYDDLLVWRNGTGDTVQDFGIGVQLAAVSEGAYRPWSSYSSGDSIGLLIALAEDMQDYAGGLALLMRSTPYQWHYDVVASTATHVTPSHVDNLDLEVEFYEQIKAAAPVGHGINPLTFVDGVRRSLLASAAYREGRPYPVLLKASRAISSRAS